MNFFKPKLRKRGPFSRPYSTAELNPRARERAIRAFMDPRGYKKLSLLDRYKRFRLFLRKVRSHVKSYMNKGR